MLFGPQWKLKILLLLLEIYRLTSIITFLFHHEAIFMIKIIILSHSFLNRQFLETMKIKLTCLVDKSCHNYSYILAGKKNLLGQWSFYVPVNLANESKS